MLSTAAAFFLVYNPKGPTSAIRNQIGYYTADGSVASVGSPGANAVNLLAEMVVLNYLALHGQDGSFQAMQWATGVSTGLGSLGTYSGLIGMPQIVFFLAVETVRSPRHSCEPFWRNRLLALHAHPKLAIIGALQRRVMRQNAEHAFCARRNHHIHIVGEDDTLDGDDI